MTHVAAIRLLIALSLAAPGFTATVVAAESETRTDGSILLARQITRIPEGDQVCCVRGTSRSRTTAEACRRALGTVKPLQECTVRRSLFGCCKLGVRTYTRTSEVDCGRRRGRMVKDIYCHVHEPVCCLQVSNTGRRTLFETTRSRCRGAGGKERPKRECSAGSFQGDPTFQGLQTAVCCRTPADIFRVTSVGCFSAGGRVVDDGYCGTRPICCRRANGSHVATAWNECKRSGGNLAGDWACRR